MTQPRCKIPVGVHIWPYWKDKNSDLVVCTNHKVYLEIVKTREWEELPAREIDIITCKLCDTTKSPTWWKCCPEHTTERGNDCVCQICAVLCEISKDPEPNDPTLVDLSKAGEMAQNLYRELIVTRKERDKHTKTIAELKEELANEQKNRRTLMHELTSEISQLRNYMGRDARNAYDSRGE